MGLPPPDPRSLCPLSPNEFVEPPPPEKKFLGTPLGTGDGPRMGQKGSSGYRLHRAASVRKMAEVQCCDESATVSYNGGRVHSICLLKLHYLYITTINL